MRGVQGPIARLIKLHPTRGRFIPPPPLARDCPADDTFDKTRSRQIRNERRRKLCALLPLEKTSFHSTTYNEKKKTLEEAKAENRIISSTYINVRFFFLSTRTNALQETQSAHEKCSRRAEGAFERTQHASHPCSRRKEPNTRPPAPGLSWSSQQNLPCQTRTSTSHPQRRKHAANVLAKQRGAHPIASLPLNASFAFGPACPRPKKLG